MKILNGHSDLLWYIKKLQINGEKNPFYNNFYKEFVSSNYHGGIYVIFMSEDEDPINEVNKSIEYALNLFKEEKDYLIQAKTHDDFIKAENEDKIAMLLGFESIFHFGTDIGKIEKYYEEVGIRQIGLTWNEENEFAFSHKFKGGLKPLGKQAVKLINEKGIILDTSHLNDDGLFDIAKITTSPIMASHSNARALCNHTRNLSDEGLKIIRDLGGIVGVNAYKHFVSEDPSKMTYDNLIDHIIYMGDLIGIEHVFFGFDFCDLFREDFKASIDYSKDTTSVTGLYREADVPNFINGMKKRGFTDKNIEDIAHNNFLNFTKKVLK